MSWRDHQFVFVGGLHRSGTTLLAHAVGSARDASALSGTGHPMDEGQFLQTEYLTGSQMGGVTRWAFHPRAHLTETDVSSPSDAAEALWKAWSPYWDTEARTLVEKTPLNILKARYLNAIFPNSSFIFITRHPLTQALAVRKWSRSADGRLGLGLEGLVSHWVRAHDFMEADLPHLEKAMTVRYEELATDPSRVIANIERIAGVKIPKNVFSDVDTERSRRYEDAWARALSRTSAPAISTPISIRDAIRNFTDPYVLRREYSAICDRHADAIQRHGYALDQFRSK